MITAADTPEDDELYALALAEVESSDKNSGLWAMALAKCDGDHDKAKAFYIRAFVQRAVQQREAVAATASVKRTLAYRRQSPGSAEDLLVCASESVRFATNLLVAGWVVLLLLALMQLPTLGIAFSLFLILFIPVIFLAWQINGGANWARWVLLVLLVVPLVESLVTLLGLMFAVEKFQSGSGVMVGLLFLARAAYTGVVLYFLFSRTAAPHFKAECNEGDR